VGLTSLGVGAGTVLVVTTGNTGTAFASNIQVVNYPSQPIIIVSGTSANTIQYSLDSGTTWSAISSVAATATKLATNGTQWMAVAASNNKYITCTYTPIIASSWTPINIGSSQGIFGMAWIPFLNLWLVSAYHGLFASSDGFNWSGRAVGITLDGAQGFASDNTYVVAVSAPYNGGGSSINDF
jgi:hypothetical protein